MTIKMRKMLLLLLIMALLITKFKSYLPRSLPVLHIGIFRVFMHIYTTSTIVTADELGSLSMVMVASVSHFFLRL
jgi:hypothetical protein